MDNPDSAPPEQATAAVDATTSARPWRNAAGRLVGGLIMFIGILFVSALVNGFRAPFSFLFVQLFLIVIAMAVGSRSSWPRPPTRARVVIGAIVGGTILPFWTAIGLVYTTEAALFALFVGLFSGLLFGGGLASFVLRFEPPAPQADRAR